MTSKPKQTQPNRNRTLPSLSEPGLRLSALLARLTAQQRAGILRIVEAEIAGLSLDSLIVPGPSHMCSHTTYYGKGGWSHNPDFVEALRLAREMDFDARLKASTRRARERIVMASPAAADVLCVSLGSADETIALRAAESVLNRTSKVTADQTPANTVVTITADEMARARSEVVEWEATQFEVGQHGAD